jgi:hypothetical protein
MRRLLNSLLPCVLFACAVLSANGQLTIGTGTGNPGTVSGLPTTGTPGEITSGLELEIIQPSTLRVGLTFDSGASLLLNMNTSTPSVATLTIPGGLTLNNTSLSFLDTATSPATLTYGTTFTLINYVGAESGDFDVNGAPVADGGTFTIGNNQFVLNYAVGDPAVDITVVPEPSTWVLTLAGVGLLVRLRRALRKPIC